MSSIPDRSWNIGRQPSGWPVGHSLEPKMHTANYQLPLQGIYTHRVSSLSRLFLNQEGNPVAVVQYCSDIYGRGS